MTTTTTTTAVGRPLDRVDGRAKVTGSARYSAEIPIPGVAYACLVGSRVASGRVTGIDTSAARAEEGVLAVLTHQNLPRVAERLPPALRAMAADALRPAGSPVVARLRG